MSDDSVGVHGGRTRRAVLAGVGAVGVSVALVGCGGDDPAGPGSAASTSGGPQVSPPASGGGDRPGGDSIARTGDIPVGGGQIFAAQGVVITQPTAGQFKAFDAICTHQRCPVAQISGEEIICTCHGSRFSTVDGSVRSGPATKPLPEKAIKVEGDRIVLA